MADIKVKNNANTTVVLKGVDTLIVPTNDGGTAVFRKWNGVSQINSKLSVACLNIISETTVQNSVDTTVSVAVTI